MLNNVGRFIYTKYWILLYVEQCGKVYLHKILGNTLCWTLWEYLFTQNTGEYFMLNSVRIFIYIEYWEYFMLNTVVFIYIQYWEIRYVKHRGKIYSSKILGNTLCWPPWEDLFTQNTRKYVMLNTVIYVQYWEVCYVEHWELLYVECCGKIYLFTQKYGGILYVEHCRMMYLYKILRITLCWTLWEGLFTQNTVEYFMLNTVWRFIYIKYWE